MDQKRNRIVGMLAVLIVAAGPIPPAEADHICLSDQETAAGNLSFGGDITSCLQEIVEETVGPALGFSATIDAPEYVYAGHPFTVVVELRLGALGTSIVEVLPIAVTGPCTMTEYHITGGIPLGGAYYLLTSMLELVPLVDPNDPPEPFNSLDIHMTWDTAQDTVGTCTPGETIIEFVDQLAGRLPKTLSKMIPVVELPATPIEMGTITSQGGNDIEDEAIVTTPALPPPPTMLPILVLTSNPKVQLKGKIIHAELGTTIDDEGYFELRDNGVKVNHATLTKSGDSKFLEAERDLLHEKGKTIETKYCLYGVYVDDGLWEDKEGPIETCMIVAAIEPGDGELLSILDEACIAFYLPSTQLDLTLYEIALAPRIRSLAGIDALGTAIGSMGYFMFDRTFGDLCE